jgi:UDP-glucose 4-epimerase
MVYASSNTVFGTADKYEKEYIPNDAPHYPSTVYGACKSLNERLAEYYFSEYGVDSVGLRFPAVYGIGHREGAASSILTEELMVKPALGKPGKVPYSGNETINWLYVEDAARGVVMASQKARTKTRAFNMGGEICSVATAVAYVRKFIPEADLTFLPRRIDFSGKFETTRMREEIGYEPQWTLEKGIKQVIEAVRNR